MALVRVYCGLASADSADAPLGSEIWLTVAVVDDAGRLLDICEISDDAGGYAELSALLAQRSGGQSVVAVAADSDDHVVTQLLTAAGRMLAYTDDDSADDYAERFADDESPEEIQSNAAERRSVGLARALQAGVLSAVGQNTPRDMLPLKPVLAAHAAVVAGRQGTAATLREVLRELYPAALRAYPDPAEPIPLAILDAMPEPGLLGGGAAGRNRDAQVVNELAGTGVADAPTLAEAITALRVAIAETPRRTGVNRALTAAVAETIRQSVAAVRASDSAAFALVGVLAERMASGTALSRVNNARPRATVTLGTAPTPLRPATEPAASPRGRTASRAASETSAARAATPAARTATPAARVAEPVRLAPAAPVEQPAARGAGRRRAQVQPAVAAVETPAAGVPAAMQSMAMPLGNRTATSQDTPARGVPAQPVPVQAVPVQAMPVQAMPVQAVPVQATPVQAVPVQAVPVQPVPVQAVPARPVPAQPLPSRSESAPVPVQVAPTPTPYQRRQQAPTPVAPLPVAPAPIAPPPVAPAPVIPPPVAPAAVRTTGPHRSLADTGSQPRLIDTGSLTPPPPPGIAPLTPTATPPSRSSAARHVAPGYETGPYPSLAPSAPPAQPAPFPSLAPPAGPTPFTPLAASADRAPFPPLGAPAEPAAYRDPLTDTGSRRLSDLNDLEVPTLDTEALTESPSPWPSSRESFTGDILANAARRGGDPLATTGSRPAVDPLTTSGLNPLVTTGRDPLSDTGSRPAVDPFGPTGRDPLTSSGRDPLGDTGRRTIADLAARDALTNSGRDPLGAAGRDPLGAGGSDPQAEGGRRGDNRLGDVIRRRNEPLTDSPAAGDPLGGPDDVSIGGARDGADTGLGGPGLGGSGLSGPGLGGSGLGGSGLNGSGFNGPGLGEDTSAEGRPRRRTNLAGAMESRGDRRARQEHDPLGGGTTETPSVDVPRQRGDARITPPWQTDDLEPPALSDLPTEPPGLRLVEPAPLTDPALSGNRSYSDELSGEFRFEPPALRLVEPRGDRPGRARTDADERGGRLERLDRRDLTRDVRGDADPTGRDLPGRGDLPARGERDVAPRSDRDPAARSEGASRSDRDLAARSERDLPGRGELGDGSGLGGRGDRDLPGRADRGAAARAGGIDLPARGDRDLAARDADRGAAPGLEQADRSGRGDGRLERRDRTARLEGPDGSERLAMGDRSPVDHLDLSDGAERSERASRANGAGRSRRAAEQRERIEAAEAQATPPSGDEGDGDLLIFAAARSAWFTDYDEVSTAGRTSPNWENSNDIGWRAAEQASHPQVAEETHSGLPKRVPQQNLVPGSTVEPAAEERPLRIVRDAAAIAAHTTGYFRGWRRGQEVGGYSVGGRQGRESSAGWDFSRSESAREYQEREYEYRSARR